MNKKDLDLSFLYQEPLIRDYSRLDEDDEFLQWMLEYQEEQDAFSKYVKDCSLDDFVYLMIVAFKDKYPNFINLNSTFHSAPLQMEKWAEVDKIRTSFEKIDQFETNFDRGDIVKLIVHMHIGPMRNEFDPGDRDMYEQKICIEFNEAIPARVLDEALHGNNYELNKEGDSTVYTLIDSPIAKLYLKDKSLEIEINEEKVYLYYVS